MPTILGPVTHIQIQLSNLKVGEKPERRYVTDPLQPVDRLKLTRDGIIGVTGAAELIDVHHRNHPRGKNDDGVHGVSVGFTSHYRAMQARYGDHMRVGCAGENIIVETDRAVTLDDVAAGLVILGADGTEKGRLVNIEVAHPCRPFSGFAHRNQTVAPEALKETLVFLDGGMRGFYCTFDENEGLTSVVKGDLLALG